MPYHPIAPRFDLFQGCEIPGAGFGYVALQDIPKGTILLEDTPIFRLPEGITNEVVRNHLIRLPPTVQQQFMDLCIGYQYLNDGEYLGRFRANALPCGYDNVDGTGRKLAGLLLLAARFNHSCVPNVTFKWDSQAGVMRFCALSAISRAQELCIAYDVSSLLFTRDARRARLQGSSGFLCHCPACIIENRDSDDRRVALYKAIVQPPQRSPRETQIEFLSRRYAQICTALTLLRMEGLSHFRETLYFDGYKLCEEAGDRNNAMLWLEKASAAAATVGGNHNAEVQRRLDAARAALQTPNRQPYILNCHLPQ